MGGAHHCVVQEPEESDYNEPLCPISPLAGPQTLPWPVPRRRKKRARAEYSAESIVIREPSEPRGCTFGSDSHRMSRRIVIEGADLDHFNSFVSQVLSGDLGEVNEVRVVVTSDGNLVFGTNGYATEYFGFDAENLCGEG
jgi:hypothetical protein